MSDEERNVNVSALRAQIQEKLAQNGHKPNGIVPDPPFSRGFYYFLLFYSILDIL